MNRGQPGAGQAVGRGRDRLGSRVCTGIQQLGRCYRKRGPAWSVRRKPPAKPWNGPCRWLRRGSNSTTLQQLRTVILGFIIRRAEPGATRRPSPRASGPSPWSPMLRPCTSTSLGFLSLLRRQNATEAIPHLSKRR